jgi:hypothetical protein
MAGSGIVSVATGLPMPAGSLTSGSTGSGALIFNWPSTVQEVQLP